MTESILAPLNQVIVKQRKELVELLGYETRNKYEVLSSSGESLLFIAENQKGLLGFMLRQFLGHWRAFDLGILDSSRNLIAVADHPFKFIFSELRVRLNADDKAIGHSVKKFSILRKKYSLHFEDGKELEINSGLLSPWTFNIEQNGNIVASIKKRWSGGLKEIFTDSDNFLIEFNDSSFNANDKLMIIAMTVLIDLSHFERKN